MANKKICSGKNYRIESQNMIKNFTNSKIAKKIRSDDFLIYL